MRNLLISKLTKCFYLVLFTVVIAGCSSETQITKSPNDPNLYREIKLENGLEAIVVSYPDTEESAAALTVQVGYYDDPKDREGLAHYLEHMLFLGSKKYPDTDYHSFMQKNGGSSNAFTSSNSTTYLFSVNSAKLEEALDRFSGFFIDPLFTPEYADRERHAVDSEYKLRINNDAFRVNAVYSKIVNQQHPSSKFSVGSLKTLEDRPNQKIHDVVKKFYKENYNADKMRLVVVGPQGIDELEDIVKEKFNAVPNRPHVKIDTKRPSPFTEKELRKKVYVKTNDNRKSLSLIFPMPSQYKNYQDNPISYVTHMLSQRSDGSLYSYLANKNYITDINASLYNVDTNDGTFEISFDITGKGYENKDQIINATFEYVRWLKAAGLSSSIYKDIKQASINQFRFQDRENPLSLAISISRNMWYYPTQDILVKDYLTEKSAWQVSKINRLLGYINPSNMLVIATGPDVPTNKKEEHYNAQYKVVALPKSKINGWSVIRDNKKWKLPEKNDFLASDFSIVAKESGSTPESWADDNNLKLWGLGLPRFKSPEINFLAIMKNKAYRDTAKNAALSSLYLDYVNHNLKKHSSQLALANVNLGFQSTTDGLFINVSSFRDSFPRVLQLVANELNIKLDRSSKQQKSTFNSLKEQAIKSLKGFPSEELYQQAMSDAKSIREPIAYSNYEIIKEMEMLDFHDLVDFIRSTKGEYQKVIAVAEGNVVPNDLKTIQNKLLNKFKFTTIKTEIPILGKQLTEDNFLWKLSPKDNDNTLYLSEYSVGEYSYENQAKLSLISNILSAKFFDDLRTNQQVGYVVAVRARANNKAPSLMFLVESPKYKTADIKQRVKKFINEANLVLKNLSDEQLADYKNGIVESILEPKKTIGEYASMHYSIARQNDTDFNRNVLIADEVKKVKAADLVQFFKELTLREPNLTIVNKNADLDFSKYNVLNTVRDGK